jgi:hypothetical protein
MKKSRLNQLVQAVTMVLLLTSSVYAQEFFVRPDGGTLEQCTGLVNQAYSVTISNKACAVNHPFELLDPQDNTLHISGGDIITIMNNVDGSRAEYEMGRHGDYTSGNCNESWNYGCFMPPIPGGSAGNPTIIRGEGWDTGCQKAPQLWGSGRATQLFTITNTQYVQLSCLEITDHSSCISAAGYPDKSLICDRSAPYNKPFADRGLFMTDASNITLTDITIAGLGNGIKAGRLGDVTLERVHLYANYSAGWEGDLADGTGNSSNTGTITFKDSAITFSGCGLIYTPGQTNLGNPHACAKQDIGGYGDGLGTAKTGGNWVFDHVQVMHNNSDGLDLLYHELGGKVTIKNSRIEGNAGNQLKISGNSEIFNNIIMGNCGWNSRQDAALGANGENCRAGGTALVLQWSNTDDAAVVLNNSISSEGDCLLQGGQRSGVTVGAVNQSLRVVNNIFYALPDYLQPFENSCMFYTAINYPTLQAHNNVIHQVKGYESPCTNFLENVPVGNNASNGTCTARTSGSFFDNADYSVASNPHLGDIKLGIKHSQYDVKTMEREANKFNIRDTTSVLYNTAYTGAVGGISVPASDYYGKPRGSQPDIGAVEYYMPPKAPVIIEVKQVNP